MKRIENTIEAARRQTKAEAKLKLARTSSSRQGRQASKGRRSNK